MEPETNILEMQKKDSLQSEDTEKMEKLESDKNSVDIQSASSHNQIPRSPEKDDKFEKFERIDETSREDKNDKENEKEENKKENEDKNSNKDEKNEQNEQNQKNEENEKEIQKIEEPEKIEKIEKKEETEEIEKIEKNEKTEKLEKPFEEEKLIISSKNSSSDKKPTLFDQLPESALTIFKASAESKKLSLESESKAKQNPKKKLISPEDCEILDRKKRRFAIVKQWDNERSHILNKQIALVDKLLIKIDQRIRFSSNSLLNITQFFKERILQETEYAKFSNKMLRFSHVFEAKNSVKTTSKIVIKEEISSGMEKFLCEIDESHALKAKNILDFATFMEKTLINEKLKAEQENYDKEVAAKKKSIDNLKKILSEFNLQTAQKAKNYSKLFSEMVNDEDFEINEKKDLYLQELGFVMTARKQSKSLKDLLVEVLKFIQDFIRLEKRKQETVKKVFEEYMNKCIWAHGPEIFSEIVEKIQMIQEKDIEEINAIHTFFTKDDASLFEEEIISYEKFEKFLVEKYKDLELCDESSLLKTKFKAFAKIGQFYENSWILFTFDKNFAIAKCNNEEEICYDSGSLCWKIEGLGVYQKDANVIEVTQNISGLIFNSKKTVAVKIEDEGVLKEIVKHLNKKP